MYKQVKYLIPVYDVDMGGIMVKQALPTRNVNQVDPFLLLHHGAFTFTDNAPAIHQGLGPHPHRGFTPVSFVIEGEVQWMFAGSPINEKVVQHGPYVMNTETEILEAMRDYQKGKMGILVEEA